MDGTLLDTMKLITSSYHKTIYHFTGCLVDEADIAKLVETSIDNILKALDVSPNTSAINFYKKIQYKTMMQWCNGANISRCEGKFATAKKDACKGRYCNL